MTNVVGRKNAPEPLHCPVHPGSIVRKDCIEASGLTIGKTAEKLGITHQALSNLVNEKSALTPQMALRLERQGWGRAEMWVRMQGSYDLARVRAIRPDAESAVRKRSGEPFSPDQS